MRRLALALLILALVPASASARRVKIVPPPLPVPAPAVIFAACPEAPDAAGCYHDPSLAMNPHTLFVAERTARTYWHEMGHAYDTAMLDDGERQKFSRMMSRARQSWLTPEIAGVFRESTNEMFADAYSTCKRGHRPNGPTWDAMVYQPRTDKGHAAVCRFIARAGR